MELIPFNAWKCSKWYTTSKEVDHDPIIKTDIFKKWIIKHTNNCHAQWRSQPDNLVPLFKFQAIIIIHFFTNWLFSQSMNTKYLHSGTKSSGWLRYWSCLLKIFINYALHVSFLILYIRLHENIPLPPYCKMILWDFFVIFHDEIKYINTNEAKRLIINITLVIKKNDIKH